MYLVNSHTPKTSIKELTMNNFKNEVSFFLFLESKHTKMQSVGTQTRGLLVYIFNELNNTLKKQKIILCFIKTLLSIYNKEKCTSLVETYCYKNSR